MGEPSKDQRFEVRPWRYLGDAGWGVYDKTNRHFTGGWFAAHLRSVAEEMVPIHEEAAQRGEK